MEGGETQVHVKPYIGTGRKWQISLLTGGNPFWSRDVQHYASMEYVDGEAPPIVWRRFHHAAM